MMSVLLANVAMWRGQVHQSVKHAREAIALFQDIGDRWGEVMATGPVVRALAELGRDGEYADTLAHYRAISRDMPDEGMRTFPEIMESLVDLQQGRPDAAHAILDHARHRQRRRRPARIRRRAGRGRACLYNSARVDEAIDVLPPVTRPPPTTVPRCRSDAGSPSRTRPAAVPKTPTSDHRRAAAARAAPSRIACCCCGRRAWRAPRRTIPTRDPIDAAYEIAIATDAPLEHAIAALARAKVLAALGTDDAVLAADEAARELDALGLTADGWSRVFDLALDEITVSS